MANVTDVSGLAALAIAESILLALNDRNVMPETAIVGVLKDAAQSLMDSPRSGSHEDAKAAHALIKKIIEGRNSVRRP